MADPDPKEDGLSPAPRRRGWLDVAEAGTVFGIYFFGWLMRLFGRPAARAFLYPVILYYVTFHRTVRRASREYLARAGIEPTFGRIYRHLLTFGRCVVDRFFFVQGQVDRFDVSRHGHEHLAALARSGKGGILLGAHLGSFEAMRAAGTAERIRIHIVGYFRNAQRINAALERLDPEGHARVVEANPDEVGFVLKIREIVEAGGLVAILADRVHPGVRSTVVPFLGGRAAFPTGPFLLAAVLGCPVYLTFGLYRGGKRYDLYCEPFAERVSLPRGRREEALVEHVARYAGALEDKCRDAPYNWFNFFDFWESEAPGEP